MIDRTTAGWLALAIATVAVYATLWIVSRRVLRTAPPEARRVIGWLIPGFFALFTTILAGLWILAVWRLR